MYRLILLLVLTLFGCGPIWHDPIQPYDASRNIVVCVDVPEVHREAVRSAIVKWDTALRTWRRIVMIESHPTSECDKAIQITESWLPEDATAAGWVPSVGGSEIFLVRGRYERDPEGVVLHELGHTFGAQHIPGTLMNSSSTPFMPRCPDIATVAQVAAYHHIELATLAWCSP